MKDIVKIFIGTLLLIASSAAIAICMGIWVIPWSKHQRLMYERSLESEEAAINIPDTEPLEITRIDSLVFLDRDPIGGGEDYVLYGAGCGCHLHIGSPRDNQDPSYVARCFNYKEQKAKELINEDEVLEMLPDRVFEPMNKRPRLWAPVDSGHVHTY